LHHLEGMEAVVRALRYALVLVETVVMTMAGSGTAAVAGVASPTERFTVRSMQPAPGDVVGVAQPVIVEFTKPVADRVAAERSIDIASTKSVTGGFSWVNNLVVQWVPDGFWPAHADVTVVAAGVPMKFGTGAAVVGVADISAHTFTVSIDGQVVRQMPASMGKPGFATPVGTFSALEKQRTVTFDSRTIGIPLGDPEGYLIKGEYAVRVTWGGVYIHSAPWSTGSQGYANVSHGCINLSPDNAAWYFNNVRTGDPVIVRW